MSSREETLRTPCRDYISLSVLLQEVVLWTFLLS